MGGPSIASQPDTKDQFTSEAVLPVVVLDPGHGGTDPGAVGVGGIAEKTVNLAIALYAAKALVGRAQAVLTRQDDRTVSLKARTDLSNARKAALFVSVHCNAFSDPRANGTETYFLRYSRVGRPLATYIHLRLISALGRRDRGVKEAGFWVLRYTLCPAALAEVAFVTNPTEAALLRTPAFQERAGKAIAAGIIDYLDRPR